MLFRWANHPRSRAIVRSGGLRARCDPRAQPSLYLSALGLRVRRTRRAHPSSRAGGGEEVWLPRLPSSHPSHIGH